MEECPQCVSFAPDHVKRGALEIRSLIGIDQLIDIGDHCVLIGPDLVDRRTYLQIHVVIPEDIGILILGIIVHKHLPQLVDKAVGEVAPIERRIRHGGVDAVERILKSLLIPEEHLLGHRALGLYVEEFIAAGRQECRRHEGEHRRQRLR